MSRPKPTSRFILFTLTLLLLLHFPTPIKSSEPQNPAADETEDGELEELLALDEQVEQEEDQDGGPATRSSEAELLSKAQRIVLELNHDNTKRVIENNEYVLVLGYAPWCARSAELMPQFAEAATALKELGSPLLMAKLDAERHAKTASSLEIKGFPTLLLFVNGTSQAYTGGFSAEEIVIWARKKTGEPVIRISSVTEAAEFLKKSDIFVLGLFENFEGPEHKEFVKAAAADSAIQFVEVSNIEVANVLFPNVKPTNVFLGIVKSEPERYTAYEGTFRVDEILQFLDYNKFPLVNRLTEANSAKVYSSPIQLQVHVFADADDFKKLLEPLQDVARQFKSKILFIYIDITDENLAKPYLTVYGLEESNSAVVTAFDIRGNSKYLLESNPSPSNLEEFCSGLLRGTVSPHFKSQPIPDNKNVTVQSIVGKTFDDLVLNSHKNVVLEVYTPWCITCETTAKHVEKLAKHFKSVDNLLFARIDASANEHPKLQVSDYPTLLLYTANDKGNPIKLSTKSSLKDVATTINKHLKAKDNAAKDEL
ncbi:protein disulfide isomerase-like 1-6 [Pyrus x bretschneideri]|uniref:protein disulfide isomerase-like 1-6 n=1 Tax=Pyrus x bretschneideri TaxID=225117 RepID=UPI0020309A67|nr:protein disulfide isomerase-like 1-6 [Pyrus x bretschneideri]